MGPERSDLDRRGAKSNAVTSYPFRTIKTAVPPSPQPGSVDRFYLGCAKDNSPVPAEFNESFWSSSKSYQNNGTSIDVATASNSNYYFWEPAAVGQMDDRAPVDLYDFDHKQKPIAAQCLPNMSNSPAPNVCGPETIFSGDQTFPNLGQAFLDPNGLVWGNTVTKDGIVLNMSRPNADKHGRSFGSRLPTFEEYERLAGYLCLHTKIRRFRGLLSDPFVRVNLFILALRQAVQNHPKAWQARVANPAPN